jgi:MoxR-like ATPase
MVMAAMAPIIISGITMTTSIMTGMLTTITTTEREIADTNWLPDPLKRAA